MAVYNMEGTRTFSIYDIDGIENYNPYDVGGNAVGLYDDIFLDTAVLSVLSSVSADGNKQGACTDGDYIYVASGDASEYTYMQIIKYKISDGTYIVKRFDGTPNFGHANDMAYNPNNGYIYVCTMLSDGSIIVLDSVDLSYVDTIYAEDQNGQGYAVWQFCYDRLNECFYSACSDGFAVYDDAWNFLRMMTASAHPSATGQGCETDGHYIYRVTYNPNYIDVMTIDGAFVKTITNPVTSEPEAMMYDWNGHYYLSCNTNGSMLYTIQLFDT